MVAQPPGASQATIEVGDGPRAVTARAAEGDERSRLWARWQEVDKNLDGYAALRSSETAVVVLEPEDEPMIARACVVVLVVLVAAPVARADYRIAGHGYGHGVGLAQYGAMGYAKETRHTYRWILSRYFPGTTRATRAEGADAGAAQAGRRRARRARHAHARRAMAAR